MLAVSRKARQCHRLVQARSRGPAQHPAQQVHFAAGLQQVLLLCGSQTYPQLTACAWHASAATRRRTVSTCAATPDAPNPPSSPTPPPPPPIDIEQGPVYPDTERDLDIDFDTPDGNPDGSRTIHSEEGYHDIEEGDVPELPFELGDDFMEEIRKYLVEEEGMDAKDQRTLDAEVFKMADNLCEMSMAEDNAEMDQEIWDEMLEQMRPYAAAQTRYEKQQRAAAAEQPSEVADSEGELAGIDMGADAGSSEESEDLEGEVDEAEFDALEDPSDMNGWGTTQGMDLPEGVSREAIATFLDWDAECNATREGPKASMGWREERGALHPSLAADQQGIKGWQLATKVHPKLAELAGNIEAMWRQMFPLDFSRTDVDPRWKLVDSVDPNQVWGIDYGTQDPEPGDPRWPRLALENRFYQTEKFRCLHLEIGIRQDGFQVLHCVMWPRREYDLPIFGADVVAVGNDVTFAIADTTPVNDAQQLPDTLVDAVRLLRAQFADGLPHAELPDWGEALFSEGVMSARPDLPVEADLVAMHITALCKTLILYSKFADDIKIDDADEDRLAEVDRAHRRYCDLQLQNDKTAAVLKRSFRYMGPAADMFVGRYMNEVLFNHVFHYDVDAETKQQLKENRQDMGMSMGISRENKGKVEDQIVESIRAGFMEAEEQGGLDGLGLSDYDDEGEGGDVGGDADFP